MLASTDLIDPELVELQGKVQAILTKEEFEAWALCEVCGLKRGEAAQVMQLSAGKIYQLLEAAFIKFGNIQH